MSFPAYPAYKQSGIPWIGALPVHWATVPYKHMVDIQNGADHKHIEQDEGYPVIGSGGTFAYASEFMCDGDSVLLGRKGTVDKPLFVSGRFWTVDTMYWTKIAEGTNPRFAYYTALTIPFDYYSTNTALPSMTKGVLNAHIVAQPPWGEQTAIAAFLDRETAKIDALVEEQKRLIELLKEKRQAVISHAVTKGLDPSVPMKDSGVAWLGEVPAHWEVIALKREAEFVTSGARGWADNYSDNGELFLRIGNLTRDTIQLDLSDTQRVVVPESKETVRTRAIPGDLLFSITAYLGSVAVIPDGLEPAYVSQHVALVRLKGCRLVPEWAAYVAASHVGKTFLETQGYGGTKVQLSLTDVANLLMLLPEAEEQRAIVDYIEHELSKLDELTEGATSAVCLLQERRSALISAAVTGKIDVRGLAPRPEVTAA